LQQNIFWKVRSDILLSGTHKMTYYYVVPQKFGVFLEYCEIYNFNIFCMQQILLNFISLVLNIRIEKNTQICRKMFLVYVFFFHKNCVILKLFKT
jgi:hypothetical protein